MDKSDADPLIGRLLLGRYQVDAKLARGGMATVYRALDTRLDRAVALKVMHPGLAEDQEFVSRFIREGRSVARLSHHGIVAVYDQGEDDGVVFLVMEYVPGRNLRDLLRERGRLTARESFDILEPMLAALGSAHDAGLVHRDIKPENILLATDGRIKIADFGLARSALASGTSQATQGVFMGTVAYLAPEQVDRGSADARSDVYSAGIVLYEMLTGAVPFSADSAIAVAFKHVNQAVPAPSSALPGLADDLDMLVLTATDREPDHRPADASALLRVVQGVRTRLSPSQLAFSPTPVDLTETLVVPIGLPAYAGSVAASHQVSQQTTALPSGASGAPFSGGPGIPGNPGPPGDPMLLTPDQIPKAARKRQGGRRLALGLTLLLLLTTAVGYGTWSFGRRTVPVTSVLNLTEAQARQKLQAAEFNAVVGDPDFSETIKAGLVLQTDPPPGAQARKGATITLLLSKGPERIAVPNLLGKTAEEAGTMLTESGLAIGAATSAFSETVPNGAIVSSDPAPGIKVRRDTPVRILVSKGIPPSIVPQVTGLTFEAATKALLAKKLAIKKTGEEFSETVAKDVVISQSLPPGKSVLRNTEVGVVVSKGPPLVKVPDVFKKDRNQAKKILEAAGFKVEFFEPFGASPFNQVLSEDPGAGSMQPKGSLIKVGIF